MDWTLINPGQLASVLTPALRARVESVHAAVYLGDGSRRDWNNGFVYGSQLR